MTRRTKGWVALGIGWVALMAFCMMGGCGVPKKPPVVPPGEVACTEACAHVEQVCPRASAPACVRLCNPVAGNNPQFPTCLSRATDCDDASACQ